MRYAVSLLAGILASTAVLAADKPAPKPAKPAAAAPSDKSGGAAPDLLHPTAPPGSRVYIIAPRDGATVGQDVLVKFGVMGMDVAPAGDTKPGTGHHHLLIDVLDLPKPGEPIPNDANHKHYGKGQTEDTIHLEPGDHTLQLDFANAAHVPFAPQMLSKKITIHVK